MENINKLKQMMQTSKMAFDYNYTMMMSAYEQNKMLMYSFLNHAADIPDETKIAIENWLQEYRKGCEQLKKLTDEGYRLVEEGMSSISK